MSDLHEIMQTLGLSRRHKLTPRDHLLTDLYERATTQGETLEIGDKEFPLRIHSSEINRRHKLVGKYARITHLANEVLLKHRGTRVKITGVVERDAQIAGLEVSLRSKRYLAPSKDFTIGSAHDVPEDIYLNSRDTMRVKGALRHWRGQRDYYGPEWTGIEWFCFALARYANEVVIESPGWYKYSSSARSDQDGKDWRYVCTGTEPLTVVNCHSLLHDNVWTLATTIFDTRNSIDRSKLDTPITHVDPWMRSMLMSIGTAEALEKQGFDYTSAKADMRRRMKLVEDLHKTKARALSDVSQALVELGDKDGASNADKGLTIVLADWNLTATSVGFWTAYDPRLPFTELHVHTAALDKKRDKLAPPRRTLLRPGEVEDYSYADYVVLHEVIHCALDEDCPGCNEMGHSGMFEKVAKIVGLPLRLAD